MPQPVRITGRMVLDVDAGVPDRVTRLLIQFDNGEELDVREQALDEAMRRLGTLVAGWAWEEERL